MHTRAGSFGTCLTPCGASANASRTHFGSILVPFWLWEALWRLWEALVGLGGSEKPRSDLWGSFWDPLGCQFVFILAYVWCHFGLILGSWAQELVLDIFDPFMYLFGDPIWVQFWGHYWLIFMLEDKTFLYPLWVPVWGDNFGLI